jgi:hypothetical protein
MEPTLSLLQTFFSNMEYLVPTVWVALGCTVAWFLLSAKKQHNMTTEEVEILWKSHKQFKQCTAKKYTEIKKEKHIIGYVCECGYEHEQERPLINFRF